MQSFTGLDFDRSGRSRKNFCGDTSRFADNRRAAKCLAEEAIWVSSSAETGVAVTWLVLILSEPRSHTMVAMDCLTAIQMEHRKTGLCSPTPAFQL